MGWNPRKPGHPSTSAQAGRPKISTALATALSCVGVSRRLLCLQLPVALTEFSGEKLSTTTAMVEYVSAFDPQNQVKIDTGKAEGRRQKAEGRRQKAEGRRRKAEGRNPWPGSGGSLRVQTDWAIAHPLERRSLARTPCTPIGASLRVQTDWEIVYHSDAALTLSNVLGMGNWCVGTPLRRYTCFLLPLSMATLLAAISTINSGAPSM